MAKDGSVLWGVLFAVVCTCIFIACIGRYTNSLANKIKTVQAQKIVEKPKIPKETIIKLYQDSLRLAVQKTYRGEKDVRELTGKNDGPRVEEYLASVGNKKGDPYCAAGVSWVFIQHDIQTVKSAWAAAWFPDSITIFYKDNFHKQDPDIADVMGIYVHAKKRIGHVGFIDQKWNNPTAYIYTFEFNTSGSGSDEGQGNYQLRRLKSQIHKVSSPISKMQPKL